MFAPILMHQAIKYRVNERACPEGMLNQFMHFFGCRRKTSNLYVDDLYNQLDKMGYQGGEPIPVDKLRIPETTVFTKQYPYLKEVDSLALSNAKIAFIASIKRYNEQFDHKSYTKRAIRRNESGVEPLSFRGLKGMPKFHSKAKGDFSYTTNCQYPTEKNGLKQPTIRFEGDGIHLPKIKEVIPLIKHRKFPEGAVIKNATVSMETDGSYYVSIGYEYTLMMDMTIREAVEKNDISALDFLRTLGLDYSQGDFYVDSEGKKANYPHYYRKSEAKLQKLQKKLSKMVIGSKNYQETLTKIRKLHTKIKNQRKDFCHQLSHELAENYDVVMVEDIDLRTMGSALNLGKNLHDNGFGMFRTFLQYKLEQKGSILVKIGRYYASTKRCSECGYVNPDVTLGVKEWVCPICGEVHDRDENAAVNIEQEGLRILFDYYRNWMEKDNQARQKADNLKATRKNKKPSKKKKTKTIAQSVA